MLLRVTDRGLWCEPAQLYIDPWAPVDRAVITHAHSDHLRFGCGQYLVAAPGEALARTRLGAHGDRVQSVAYGEPAPERGADRDGC